jgi:hypothetical protein
MVNARPSTSTAAICWPLDPMLMASPAVFGLAD